MQCRSSRRHHSPIHCIHPDRSISGTISADYRCMPLLLRTNIVARSVDCKHQAIQSYFSSRNVQLPQRPRTLPTTTRVLPLYGSCHTRPEPDRQAMSTCLRWSPLSFGLPKMLSTLYVSAFSCILTIQLYISLTLPSNNRQHSSQEQPHQSSHAWRT